MKPRSAPKDYIYYTAAGTFFVILFLSIALVKFGIPGLPLRAILAILLLAFIWMTIPSAMATSLARARPVLMIVLICAAIGIFASVMAGTTVDVITRQVLEIHFQAAVGLLLGFSLILACGPSATAKVMVAVVLLSAGVALLQGLGFGPAWGLREFFQRLQPIDASLDSIFLTARLRAMGLSYSPVHLGTQLCLAWACWTSFTFWRFSSEESADRTRYLVIGSLVFLIGALASGNRSPILGMMAFWVIFLFKRQPGIAVIIALTAIPSFAIVDDILQSLAEAGLRAANVDDGSATNRRVLRAFGFMLLMDRPYGYGLNFNSPDYWAGYWDALKNYPNAVAIRIHALHNYYLMMANKYGIGIFAVGAFVAYRLFLNKNLMFAFLPYVTHIFYHNDGPLQGDFMIWYILPSVLLMTRAQPRQNVARMQTLPHQGRPPLAAGVQ